MVNGDVEGSGGDWGTHLEGGAALLKTINARLPKRHPKLRIQMKLSLLIVWDPLGLGVKSMFWPSCSI